MSYDNSYIVDDCYDSNRSTCEDELFDGILSDVESLGSKADQELINYFKQGSKTHTNASSRCNTITYTEHKMSDSKCMSKNAVLARENRQKKKEYVQTLEKDIENLKDTNSNLKRETKEMEEKITNLESEVEYLKGVIANQSTLSKLIGSVCTTPGVRFYSSFTLNNNSVPTNQSSEESSDGGKRKSNVLDAENENQENALPQRKSRRNLQSNKYNANTDSANANISQSNENSGICLHVAGDSVSLELCSMCSKNSSRTRKTASSASSVLREKVGKRKK